MDTLNKLATDYEPLIIAFGVFSSFIISAALFWLAWSTGKSRQYQVNKDAREVFLSVYNKISKGLGIVFREGTVNEDAKALFWQARDQARLELPDDVERYTQELFDKMYEIYLLERKLRTSNDGGLPAGIERDKAADRQSEIIMKLIEEQPSKVFAPYLKIKTSLTP